MPSPAQSSPSTRFPPANAAASARSFQVTDTGIQPGSGVGNHRAGITRETMGVPVIAVGVPTVVYGSVIIRDALRQLLDDYPDASEREAAAYALAQRILSQPLGEMVVTPREIDQLVAELSQVIGHEPESGPAAAAEPGGNPDADE